MASALTANASYASTLFASDWTATPEQLSIVGALLPILAYPLLTYEEGYIMLVFSGLIHFCSYMLSFTLWLFDAPYIRFQAWTVYLTGLSSIVGLVGSDVEMDIEASAFKFVCCVVAYRLIPLGRSYVDEKPLHTEEMILFPITWLILFSAIMVVIRGFLMELVTEVLYLFISRRVAWLFRFHKDDIENNMEIDVQKYVNKHDKTCLKEHGQEGVKGDAGPDAKNGIVMNFGADTEANVKDNGITGAESDTQKEIKRDTKQKKTGKPVLDIPRILSMVLCGLLVGLGRYFISTEHLLTWNNIVLILAWSTFAIVVVPGIFAVVSGPASKFLSQIAAHQVRWIFWFHKEDIEANAREKVEEYTELNLESDSDDETIFFELTDITISDDTKDDTENDARDVINQDTEQHAAEPRSCTVQDAQPDVELGLQRDTKDEVKKELFSVWSGCILVFVCASAPILVVLQYLGLK
ncbi:hypothetical protein TARUN_1440 [Trichoderma arundinaceum]|uniref:Uncharacterized protein n=1 Tax=Trichoderma arundinaceum TaxID=490622 RepID=A0A395NXQ1_TRIAR|nr:hypothetical protein TARUN_1440 [Trichoderma arundinaceum]